MGRPCLGSIARIVSGGKILPFPSDFEGFFTLETLMDFVVFGRVCPVGHSFLVRKVYKWGQNRDCVGRRRLNR
jgi:hypothetical protein